MLSCVNRRVDTNDKKQKKIVTKITDEKKLIEQEPFVFTSFTLPFTKRSRNSAVRISEIYKNPAKTSSAGFCLMGAG